MNTSIIIKTKYSSSNSSNSNILLLVLMDLMVLSVFDDNECIFICSRLPLPLPSPLQLFKIS